MTRNSILLEKDSAMRVILENHLLALFRDRPKRPGRSSFCAVLRQGGFKVVIPRALQCCDIILLETTLSPDDTVNEQLISMCLQRYVEWELRF